MREILKTSSGVPEATLLLVGMFVVPDMSIMSKSDWIYVSVPGITLFWGVERGQWAYPKKTVLGHVLIWSDLHTSLLEIQFEH